MTPEAAKSEALLFLDQTTRRAALDWSVPREPTAEQCSGGVKFQYLVHAPLSSTQSELADTLAAYWRSKGMSVERTQEDFGAGYGLVYAATARAQGSPGAAFEITRLHALVYIDSQCVAGEADD